MYLLKIIVNFSVDFDLLIPDHSAVIGKNGSFLHF